MGSRLPVDADAIAGAAQRIEPHVVRTPLFESEPWSQRHGGQLLIKSEHLQRTGSFKVRGSANVVHALDSGQAERGVVTASSGNHGIGVATAAASRGIAARIFLPRSAAQSKIDQIQRLGADITLVDSTDTFDAELAARAFADDHGVQYVSPYNDPLIVAGQGTIGKEILEDNDRLGGDPIDAVVVAVGGGGMISGIATWIKAHAPDTLIVAASAANDRAMAASIEAGEIITPEFEPTFSDGTAGALEPGSITFDICRDLVDEWVDVSELAIATAVTRMIDDHHQLVEGSAGLALAAATDYVDVNPGARVVAVSCGANVTSPALAAMITLARTQS